MEQAKKKTTSGLFDEALCANAKPWRAPPMQDGAVVSQDLYAARGLGPPTAADMEEWEKQSREEGFKRGHQEGLAAAQQETQKELGAIAQLRAGLTNSLHKFDEQAEQELMQLVMIVAQQLLRRELRADPGEIVAIIQEARNLLPAAARQVRVHLHPEDAVLVREILLTGGDLSLQLVEDPAVSHGGCRVRTEHSYIDASLENRIAALSAEILGGERGTD